MDTRCKRGTLMGCFWPTNICKIYHILSLETPVLENF